MGPIPNVSYMLENIVGCKWSLRVLSLIRKGVRRPGAMQKSTQGLSAKVLNERLSKMIRYGILERKSYSQLPLHVEYHLTRLGKKFTHLIDSIETLQSEIENSTAHTRK
jgi:DNA-binding HxlR family transcriptional regulator